MKILYALQGTGNGHVSRALEIVPHFRAQARVDVLISGCQADLTLPFPVTYRCHGMSFIFGKKGGVDYFKTWAQMKSRDFYNEVVRLPVNDYDLVISDFEPISAWACHFRKKPCLALSHQCAVLAPGAPQPRREDALGRFILKNYAPATAHLGFHFNRYAHQIFTPVIRNQIRQLKPSNQGHYLVYLPAYDDVALVAALQEFKDVQWEVFSKHNHQASQYKNIRIYPIQPEAFIRSLAGCAGVLCGAGFETPAEALFLQKKLLVIPMKGQFEQHCNAAALKEMGVPVVKNLKAKHRHRIRAWLDGEEVISVDYPDETAAIVEFILKANF